MKNKAYNIVKYSEEDTLFIKNELKLLGLKFSKEIILVLIITIFIFLIYYLNIISQATFLTLSLAFVLVVSVKLFLKIIGFYMDIKYGHKKIFIKRIDHLVRARPRIILRKDQVPEVFSIITEGEDIEVDSHFFYSARKGDTIIIEKTPVTNRIINITLQKNES